MWKICQNPVTGEKILVHAGYDLPSGFFEIGTTSNQNFIEDELREIVEGFGFQYDPLVSIVTYFTRKVDAIADEAYTLAVSSPAKLQEYTQAEIDAKAYMANKAVRQPFVEAWADATGWTDEQAALDILKTAALFRGALLIIRTKRLSAKEKIRKSNGNTDTMKMVLEDYNREMDMLKAQLVSG